jgi:hypothetical protein
MTRSIDTLTRSFARRKILAGLIGLTLGSMASHLLIVWSSRTAVFAVHAEPTSRESTNMPLRALGD